MTPRVPTLVESEEEAETSEETQEFTTTAPISDKVSFLKQSAVTTIYVVEAIKKKFHERAELVKLAKSRLEKIKSLESQLAKEKVTSTQFHQNLDKANEELRRLRKEKEMND